MTPVLHNVSLKSNVTDRTVVILLYTEAAGTVEATLPHLWVRKQRNISAITVDNQ